jgi:hypothetical protein
VIEGVLIGGIEGIELDVFDPAAVIYREQLNLGSISPGFFQSDSLSDNVDLLIGGLGIAAAALEEAYQFRIILFFAPRFDFDISIDLIIDVVESAGLPGSDFEMFCEGYCGRAAKAAARNERMGHQRIDKRLTGACEEFCGLAFDCRFFLAVEIESEFTPMEILPGAGEPEIVDASGAVFVEDYVLAGVIDVELGIGAAEAIVVAAGSIVAR